MSDSCCSTNANIMLLACSGASNLGQIANQAAVQLTQDGFGRMFCLAAIGAHINNFLKSAKEAPRMVAIDGCPIGCAKKLLEHCDVPPDRYVIVSDLGIEKVMSVNLDQRQIDEVKAAARKCYEAAHPDSTSMNLAPRGCRALPGKIA